MGKKLLLTLLVLTFISALTGKRIYEEQLPDTSDIGFFVPEVLPDPDLQPLVERFEAYVTHHLEQEGVPGATIAMVKDSSVIYLKTFGLKEQHTFDSINIHTAFRLASVSKGFAPVLVGMLVEDGVLNWDDRIIDFLPDFKMSKKRHTEELTIRHVLSHTTGLPRHTYSNLLDEGWSYPEIRDMLRNVPVTHPVGAFYNYQNVAYSLVADVVEKATGKTYTQLLKERIFDPLNMRGASASFNELMSYHNIAIPHLRDRYGYQPIPISPNYYTVAPAAGVNATIVDMTQWLQFLLGNNPGLLAGEILDEIFRPQIDILLRDKSIGQWRDLADHFFYALGWRVLRSDTDTIVYHGGYVNGYRSEVAMIREDNFGIVVLSNAPSNFTSECLPSFFEMYREFKGGGELNG
jgi:beta-lactamase class C